MTRTIFAQLTMQPVVAIFWRQPFARGQGHDCMIKQGNVPSPFLRQIIGFLKLGGLDNAIGFHERDSLRYSSSVNGFNKCTPVALKCAISNSTSLIASKRSPDATRRAIGRAWGFNAVLRRVFGDGLFSAVDFMPLILPNHSPRRQTRRPLISGTASREVK